ncbi:hypothetical protein V8E53_001690 [Lactarius tabidus]
MSGEGFGGVGCPWGHWGSGSRRGDWGVGGSTSVGGSWGAVDGPRDAGRFDPDWAHWVSPSWGVGVWDGNDWLGTWGFAGGVWGAVDGPQDAGRFDPDWAHWASPSWGVGVWDGDDWLGTQGFFSPGGGFGGAVDGRAGSVLAHQHAGAHSVLRTCDLMLAQACIGDRPIDDAGANFFPKCTAVLPERDFECLRSQRLGKHTGSSPCEMDEPRQLDGDPCRKAYRNRLLGNGKVDRIRNPGTPLGRSHSGRESLNGLKRSKSAIGRPREKYPGFLFKLLPRAVAEHIQPPLAMSDVCPGDNRFFHTVSNDCRNDQICKFIDATVCVACAGWFWPWDTELVKLNDLEENQRLVPTYSQPAHVLLDDVKGFMLVSLCNTCLSYQCRNKTPPLSLANGM